MAFALSGISHKCTRIPIDICSMIDGLAHNLCCSECNKTLISKNKCIPFRKNKISRYSYFRGNIYTENGILEHSKQEKNTKQSLTLHENHAELFCDYTPKYIIYNEWTFMNQAEIHVQRLEYKCILRENDAYYYCIPCFFDLKRKKRYFAAFKKLLIKS